MRGRLSSRQSRNRSPAQVGYNANLKKSSRFPQIGGEGGEGVPATPNATVPVQNNSGLSIGVCTQQGKRPYQEDEYSIHPHLSSSGANVDTEHDPESHFFGLFDGHAGGRCSKHVGAFLPGKCSFTK